MGSLLVFFGSELDWVIQNYVPIVNVSTVELELAMCHVNHAGFDDVKKNFLDNDCHHQKRGECECMNTWF